MVRPSHYYCDDEKRESSLIISFSLAPETNNSYHPVARQQRASSSHSLLPLHWSEQLFFFLSSGGTTETRINTFTQSSHQQYTVWNNVVYFQLSWEHESFCLCVAPDLVPSTTSAFSEDDEKRASHFVFLFNFSNHITCFKALLPKHI